jgi:hypothetical protein
MHGSFSQSVASHRIGRFLIAIVAVYGMLPLYAETKLSGAVESAAFTADGNPYIVENTLLIPEGRQLVIGEGCHFYFGQFAGIMVEGSLKVTGTTERPVLFTSINDSLSMQQTNQIPNPFDWNGIYIPPKAATVELSNVIIAYSVFGIKSQKESFTLINGSFKKNGQYHCTINEKVMPIAEGIPFTYVTHSVVYDPNGATSGQAPVDTVRYNKDAIVKVPENSGTLAKTSYSFGGWNSSPDGTGRDYPAGTAFVMGENDVRLYARWFTQRKSMNFINRKEVPIIIGGTGIVLGGVSLAFLYQWLDGKNEYDLTTNVDDLDKLSDRGKVSSAIAIPTGAVSVAAITAGVVLYLWQHPEKRVAVTPFISPTTTGAILVVRM